jgi:hypothetical protein
VNLKLLALSVLAAGSLGVSGVASANLLTNGDFETGSFAGWTTSGLTCSGVGSAFNSATGGCFGYDGDPGPHGGTAAAYLGTAAGGGVISQSFDTVAGAAYVVNFYLANGAYQQVTAPNSLSVVAGGNLLLSLTDAGAQGFVHYTYEFLASSDTSSLVITHGNVPSFFILDDVSVTSVPEPSSLLLMGIGLAGVAFFARRRAV